MLGVVIFEIFNYFYIKWLKLNNRIKNLCDLLRKLCVENWVFLWEVLLFFLIMLFFIYFYKIYCFILFVL